MLCPSCGYDNIEGMDRCANCMEPLRDLDVPRADASAGVVRSVMEHDLGALAQREALVVEPQAEAAEAARALLDANADAALVVEGGRFAGVVTAGDLARALAGEGGAARVADVMTRDVMPIDEAASVAQAMSQMAIGETRYLPVEHPDGRRTIVSAAGLLDYIAGEEW